MALNIITAKFCSGATQTWTDEAYQWDYGQVLQFDGLDLPEAYQVHFSNTPMTGKTITQVGGADGVTVPDQFFLTGETIYAWLYLHEGEDDGETVYMVTIPVKKRPQPSDDVPTPVEQSAIDQAIAALNIAVEKAEDAIEHYPTIIDGTWHVWDVTEEEYVDTGVEAQGEQGQPGRDGTDGQDGRDGIDGQDGFSPIITVTDITGGHRVTITDATGTQTFDVMNGQPGTPGRDGTDGTDGYSPTVTVTEITGGHRVTITDAQGAHSFDVLDGQGGSVTVDDELSTTSTNPVQNKVITEELNDVKADLSELSSSIAPVESSATATAAHAVGGLFMMGETLMVALSAIAIGDTITTEGGSPNAAVTKLTDKLIKDVQVNGTSVVSQGVANVPIMSTTVAGVAVRGTGLYISGSNQLNVNTADLESTKSGTSSARIVSNSSQHESVFYGLAKAGGDSTQSASSNPVGTYTDAAKVAIQKMLGVYREWELIADYTVPENSAQVDVITDTNGQAFELSKMFVRVWLQPSTTGTNDFMSAIALCNMKDGGTGTANFPTVRYMANGATTFMEYVGDMMGGVNYATGAASSVPNSSVQPSKISSATDSFKSYRGFRIGRFSTSTSLVPKDTVIKIYGIRA